MSWEAFRLTSKSPSELYGVMSPSGVDHLVREMLMDCWRRLPDEEKTIEAWRREIDRVWQRNMRVWGAIKKPAPEAFFRDLAPFDADGHLRQALVLTWMMLPRAGGREFGDVKKIVSRVFDRNVEAWEADNRTFNPAAPTKKRRAKEQKKKVKSTKKAAVKKKASRKK
jgi:hypothetical protein